MAFLKAMCSGGKLHETRKCYLVLDVAEVSGVFMGSGFDILIRWHEWNRALFYEFPGCASDPGIIDQMKTSPEKICLKALNQKAELLLFYSPFWKERESPFIFVYFLA